MNNKKQKTNFLIAVIIALIGVGIGITAFIFGILTLKNKGGSPLTMGTDLVFGTSNSYNTLSYTAMAYTANNLERVNLTLRVIKDALAYLLIIFGLLIVLLSIYKFIKYIQKQLVATSISEINNSEINNKIT
jgi:hypothetical protein